MQAAGDGEAVGGKRPRHLQNHRSLVLLRQSEGEGPPGGEFLNRSDRQGSGVPGGAVAVAAPAIAVAEAEAGIPCAPGRRGHQQELS